MKKSTIEQKMRKIKKEYTDNGISFMESPEYKKLLQAYNKILNEEKKRDVALYKLRDVYRKEVLDSKKNDKKDLSELFNMVKEEMKNK